MIFYPARIYYKFDPMQKNYSADLRIQIIDIRLNNGKKKQSAYLVTFTLGTSLFSI
jgi:hypothetical protein